MKRTPTQEQQFILDAFKTNKTLKVNACAGSGKEQPVSTSTPTPKGFVPFGSLKVGDEVFGKNGKPTKITAIYPQGMKDVYEVTFRDGSKTRCGLEHNWAVISSTQRDKSVTKTLTTSELMEKGLVHNSGSYRFKVPMVSAVEFPEQSLMLHPYILGVFLGDGTLSENNTGGYGTPALSFHEQDIEIYERVIELFHNVHNITLVGKPRYTSEHGKQVSLITSSDNISNVVTGLFKTLGVSSRSKHIPYEYLFGSVEQRLALLQGLMDTDGCVSRNRTTFSNTNKVIVDGVIHLVQSLGGTAILHKTDTRKNTTCYSVNVKMSTNPFLLSRKHSNWKPSWKNPPSRYITKIEHLGIQEEQMCITVDAPDSLYLTNDFIVTHNTSTLEMLAHDNVVPSIYLAFNNVVATEARERFPAHVECRTQHSIAYSAFGKLLQHKLSRPQGGGYVNVAGTVSEIVKYYGIKDILLNDDAILARSIGALVKGAVQRYQYSKDEHLTQHHIVPKDLKDILNTHNVKPEKVVNLVLSYANKLWKDRVDPLSPVLCDHDTYLKLWQLSSPKINYDIIYLDESQDVNPVVYDVVSKQTHCKIVYVGDKFQSIYGFRHAINAMDKIQAPVYHLTKSFRFGQAIADVATDLIQVVEVKGNENINSQLQDVTAKQYTMIFRTNAHLIGTAVTLVSQGHKIKCEVDTKKFENQLKSAQALFDEDMKNVKEETVALYSKWADLVEALDEHVELKRVVDIVLGKATPQYLHALNMMKRQSSNYDILLITAHKSKGMEWDNVVLAEDFDFDLIFKETEVGMNQELNLFYVACTRAKVNLQLPKEYKELYEFNTSDLDADIENYPKLDISVNEISSDDLFMQTVRRYNETHGNFLFDETEVFEDELRHHYN